MALKYLLLYTIQQLRNAERNDFAMLAVVNQSLTGLARSCHATDIDTSDLSRWFFHKNGAVLWLGLVIPALFLMSW